MTRAMLHRPMKSTNRIISAVTKNRRTTVLYQNDSSGQKMEKMKLNPQWLEKYSLVTVRREVWCNDMLTLC